MFGKWSDKIQAKNEETGETIDIYQIAEKHHNSEWNYHFSTHTIKLNDIDDEYRAILPATDCRLRPDQRAYENGNIELASAEKHRLEQK